jgi:hypothetical protein
MNTAPDAVDAGWGDKIGAFFTFGPGSTTAVYILTALGFLLFIGALVLWFAVEDRKLTAQAEMLRRKGLQTESIPAVSHSVKGVD